MYALKQIDKNGSPDQWINNIVSLFSQPISRSREGGIVDIVGSFSNADGQGLYKLGIRLLDRGDGSFDLVTILTAQ